MSKENRTILANIFKEKRDAVFFNERLVVSTPDVPGAVQRPLPSDWTPTTLE